MYRKPFTRAGKHLALEVDFSTLHNLWYRRICDILQAQRYTPVKAFTTLYAEVKLSSLDIPSTELQNFRLAWNSFARKCNQTNSKL